MANTNHTAPITRAIRRASVQLDAFLDHDDPRTVHPARTEAGLRALEPLARWLGGRMERRYQVQVDRFIDHDANLKPERLEAVMTLLERAITQCEQYRLLVAKFN